MKAVIFHGTDDKAGSYWQAWLKTELEKANYKVDMPYYPDLNHESIDTFLPKVLSSHEFDKDTVLIGHSAGGPLILSILEKIKTPVSKAILVAGYSQRNLNETKDPVLQDVYKWDKIKSNCPNFTFINSVNDPWGCDDKQGRILFDHLGGTQIIKDEGHFGSGIYNQPCPEFPLVRDLILESIV